MRRDTVTNTRSMIVQFTRHQWEQVCWVQQANLQTSCYQLNSLQYKTLTIGSYKEQLYYCNWMIEYYLMFYYRKYNSNKLIQYHFEISTCLNDPNKKEWKSWIKSQAKDKKWPPPKEEELSRNNMASSSKLWMVSECPITTLLSNFQHKIAAYPIIRLLESDKPSFWLTRPPSEIFLSLQPTENN